MSCACQAPPTRSRILRDRVGDLTGTEGQKAATFVPTEAVIQGNQRTIKNSKKPFYRSDVQRDRQRS
jgi:hypothetical protein